jgi:hypothetical protein
LLAIPRGISLSVHPSFHKSCKRERFHYRVFIIVLVKEGVSRGRKNIRRRKITNVVSIHNNGYFTGFSDDLADRDTHGIISIHKGINK